MHHALVRRDLRMLDDPLRTHSLALTAGAVLAVVLLAGCAILALVRPAADVGDAAMVMDRASGALYVRIGDRLHPAANYASARLITGAAEPRAVDPSAIARMPRGRMVGIPGAPNAVGRALTEAEIGWSICDSGTSTTLAVGAEASGAGSAAGEDAMLVSVRTEGPAATYLLYGGWRAAVDLRDIAVVRALRLDGIVPQPVSRSLLDSVPEAPPLTAPLIPAAGAAGPAALDGLTVGTVVRVVRAAPQAGAADYFVVLGDGVQPIGEVAADLIRFTVAQPGDGIPTVAAASIAALPAVQVLAPATFPARVQPVRGRVLCAHWDSGAGGTVAVTESLPGAPGIELAGADGAGPNVDAVLMPAGRSAFIRSTGLVGAGAGALFLLDDLGVLYGIRDIGTAKRLGLERDPLPAPWPMLARLPRGPELVVPSVAGAGPGGGGQSPG